MPGAHKINQNIRFSFKKLALGNSHLTTLNKILSHMKENRISYTTYTCSDTNSLVIIDTDGYFNFKDLTTHLIKVRISLEQRFLDKKEEIHLKYIRDRYPTETLSVSENIKFEENSIRNTEQVYVSIKSLYDNLHKRMNL